MVSVGMYVAGNGQDGRYGFDVEISVDEDLEYSLSSL